MEADKRYVAVQMMLKHKAICCDKKISKHRRRINCTECEFVVKDSMIMRRHIRDVHEITSISTSPPAKNIRKSTVDNSDIEDLSLKLEDMDIENAEEEILLERSRKCSYPEPIF